MSRNYALAVFLIAVGAGLAYAFLRLGGTFARLSAFIKGNATRTAPVIHKVGESVDRVNGQLDKVDQVTDSAVDMADSVDTAVRAVSLAIATPVQKLSGLAAGLAHGAATLKSRRDWGEAVETGKEAAARREHDLEEELRAADGAALDGRGHDHDPARAPVRGGRRPRRRRHRRTARPHARGLDDLQLALDSLLDRDEDDEGEVTIVLAGRRRD